MGQDIKWYTIGGKRFYQEQASAWQKAHIIKLLGGKDLDQLSVSAIIGLLGPDGLLSLYGLLLIEEGQTKEEFIKNLMTPGGPDHRLLFATHIDEALTLEVLVDFLAYILEPSNIDRISEALGRFRELFPEMGVTPSGNSTGLPPSLAEVNHSIG